MRTRWLLLLPLLALPRWAGATGLEALRNAAEQSPQALARLRNLAEQGNARAELYLGTLYARPSSKGANGGQGCRHRLNLVPPRRPRRLCPCRL